MGSLTVGFREMGCELSVWVEGVDGKGLVCAFVVGSGWRSDRWADNARNERMRFVQMSYKWHL